MFEGERVREEFTYTWPNGENHFFETSWSPIRIGDEIVGAAEITRDITDITKMKTEAGRLRAELSRMDRVSMMGVLTAGIAHEINQPLSAILSNAQAALRLITKDPPDLEEVKKALKDIVSDDKRAGEMVHSIRNILRKYDPKREQIDLNETVREMLVLVTSEALIEKISLSVNLEPDIPTVYGDRIQIQQVVLNLVMNSLEALKEQHGSVPEIIVSTQVKEYMDVKCQ